MRTESRGRQAGRGMETERIESDSGVMQGMLPGVYGRSIRYVEDRNERDVISFVAPPRQQTQAGLTDNSPQCGSSWATSCM